MSALGTTTIFLLAPLIIGGAPDRANCRTQASQTKSAAVAPASLRHLWVSDRPNVTSSSCPVCPVTQPGKTAKKAECTQSDVEKRIASKLRETVNINFRNVELEQAVEDLKYISGLNIIVDKAALKEANFDPKAKLSLVVRDVSFGSALKLLLEPVRLTFIVKDQVIQITTPAMAVGKLVQVTYPVADLVIPINYNPDNPKVLRGGKTIEEKLIQLITSTVAPSSWIDAGGCGTIQYFPLGMGLVVKQPLDIQEQVGDLLAALRRLQDVEVAVEIRFGTVSEEVAERILKEHKATTDNKGVITIDDAQVLKLLKLCQTDRNANVMQPPRMTVFNGQKGKIEATESLPFMTGMNYLNQNGQNLLVPKQEVIKTGVELTVLPVVSADRRSVSVELKFTDRRLDPHVPLIPMQFDLGPEEKKLTSREPRIFQVFIQQPVVQTLSVDKTFKIENGQTAVFVAGKVTKESPIEFGPPVLSKIPYVGRLFTNVGYGRETQTLLVLVTTRIIINEEEKVPVHFENTGPVPRP